VSIRAERAAPRPVVPATRADLLRGLGFLVITTLSWGANWPLVKYMLAQMPPFSMRVLGSLIGVVFAFGLARLRRENLRVPRNQWRPLVISTLLNFTAFVICSTTAMLWLSASEAVIIAYTLPIWAALLAWPILGERPTLRRIAALIVGLAGVGLLMGEELRGLGSAASDRGKLIGIGFALAGAVLFALGTVISKRRPLALPPVTAVAWQVGIGTVPMALLAVFERPDWSVVTTWRWIALAYVGIVPLCLAYLAWFRALRLLPASTAAIGTLMVPMIGVGLAAAMLGEPLGARQLGALALTLGGVALAVRG
jgi:drug/metabolite transporter (DMT)-like permease